MAGQAVDSISRVVRSTGGPPADGQTAQFLVGTVSVNLGATVTWMTVPAGSTLYITDIICTSNTTTPFDITLKSGTTPIFQGHVFSTAPLDCCGIDTQPQAAANSVVTLLAGVAASTQLDYNIFGYLQAN